MGALFRKVTASLGSEHCCITWLVSEEPPLSWVGSSTHPDSLRIPAIGRLYSCTRQTAKDAVAKVDQELGFDARVVTACIQDEPLSYP